jgi:2-polyprenyl-6-methoxyphenol hydroxylase-like FAD-dependent oxidoreductase
MKSPGYELCPGTKYIVCVVSDKGVCDSSVEMKQFILANLRSLKVPADALSVIERSETNGIFAVPLRFRSPLSLVTASICRGNVCVASDALHPMTPDLAQGGCSALEDAVVLARCLGKAVSSKGPGEATTQRTRGSRRGSVSTLDAGDGEASSSLRLPTRSASYSRVVMWS